MIEKCFWQNSIPGRQSFGYLKALPPDFDCTKKYPLLVFLHGSGECGDDVELVRFNGPLRFGDDGNDMTRSFIIVAPQCPEDKYWGCFQESLNDFLDSLIKELPVDSSRIYLTGLSMGGTGTWLWALSNPERFAAIAPVCGCGIPWYAGRLCDMPVWAFHGDKDDAVDVSGSIQMTEAVNRCGGDAKLTLYGGVGHNCWVQAYGTPELYEWLLSHKLG